MDIKTFVFLDLETTGLIDPKNYPVKITELSLIAVESKHLKNGIPRVKSKLNICFNPKKDIPNVVSEITGLTTELLEFQPEFSKKTVDLIEIFLAHFVKPICFVAHNGFKFDYPILQSEVKRCGKQLPNDILFTDSLNIFRDISKQQNLTGKLCFKLEDIYLRIFGEKPTDGHEAEGDTITLLKCVASESKNFLSVVVKNILNLSDIKSYDENSNFMS